MTSIVDSRSEPARRGTPSGLTTVTRAPGWLRYALLVVGLAVALWLPNGLYPAVAVDILCWALFAVAVDLLLGFTGLLSFGHAAFWGVSAYVTGLVAIHLGLPFPAAVLAGAFAAAVLAVPIGYLAVRRTGIYFAMVTLAFAQLVYYVANEWRSVTQGENGLQGVPRELFGLDLTDDYYFYYAILPIVLLGLAGAWRIVHSPFGRVLVGIRDNPARARALGYPVHRYKLTIFVLSGFVAGLGGGLFAVSHRFVSLEVLHWTTSGKAVIVVVLGGIGTLWGGVLGAGIVVRLEDWLSFSGFEAIGLVTGGLFVLVVLLFRRGIWGTASALARRRWAARRD
ncbi:branched-chain amino acid ABC transporter permease [Salinispora arenicola]|uniref:Amino acid/amide ABC transporter membrane protein 2 (HAAT family) n=2 Tax=Salinispora arenicola TaxID=168697 RepID=A0A542XU14_SALAC|nr:branched-chain amino acid ABC transporter permease [Salinispora arenicola]MCN0154843.1 branched-chain amino acid ABC transporter permease [Salinispora arenicola]MCN0180484.1 branched-chain amino acid ABC transporter permease [Salinispora arenicola]NIL59607.1 branched-chain amino acid ABC transporter permease [Salinispora arenicola]NIL61299.1 branched-chain amino acid ABC transporter permease [Salinispora arenicola]TQL39294.1 amino acid/amide ABC transporter membrane protein 2 (HAAT family) 